MNLDKLRTIFANYIRKFDLINNKEHKENYKWEVAARFPALMDPDAQDFLAGMKEVKKISKNLIDSSAWPLKALIHCAEMDENAVRDLFRALFADDGGSLIMRQRKIDAFISNANDLIAKAYTDYQDISQFTNNQRSAMSFLFFHDPEHHYLYKYTQVAKFASTVDFRDDLGYGKLFKMDVYYRMCDELVEEIKKSDLLLRTTRRRYYNDSGERLGPDTVHPDRNYHILAFDIIWGTGIQDIPDYNFGEGISYMNEQMVNSTPPPPRIQQLPFIGLKGPDGRGKRVSAYGCSLFPPIVKAVRKICPDGLAMMEGVTWHC